MLGSWARELLGSACICSLVAGVTAMPAHVTVAPGDLNSGPEAHAASVLSLVSLTVISQAPWLFFLPLFLQTGQSLSM